MAKGSYPEETEHFTVDSEEGVGEDLMGRVEAVLDANHALFAACPDAETAARVTTELYRRFSGTLHVEHVPVTNDETGDVNYVALQVRQIHYDRDEKAWLSTDTPTEPGIVIKQPGH